MLTILPQKIQEKIVELLMADDFIAAKQIYDEWFEGSAQKLTENFIGNTID